MAVDLSMPVLVVDDYKTMIRIIRNLLKQLGFQNVDDASDGTEALEKMRENKYGLVISDWNMEPMTGYELLKHVRADENLTRTPFIMVTAESKTEKCDCREKSGRKQLHRETFQCRNLEKQNRGRVWSIKFRISGQRCYCSAIWPACCESDRHKKYGKQATEKSEGGAFKKRPPFCVTLPLLAQEAFYPNLGDHGGSSDLSLHHSMTKPLGLGRSNQVG